MLSAALDNIALLIILTGCLVGMAAALPGTFLVLRGSSMLTDAISHSIVFGIVIVWLATRAESGPIMIVGAGLAGLLCVALIEALARTGRVRIDAAIGLVFPALFALGVLLINLYARNVHIDEHRVLLGEIGLIWLETVTLGDYRIPYALLANGVLLAVNAVFIGLFYKELKLATFDRALAHALGFFPGLLFYALLALTSTTAVAAFDAVGAILFIAFAIVPPATALLLTDRLSVMIALAMAVAVGSSVTGYFMAVYLDTSIGGMMASMTGVFFTLAFLLGPRHGLIAGAAIRARQRRDMDCRSLAVHLLQHEDMADAETECTAEALQDHLRWSPHRARRAVLAGLDRGLMTRSGDRLALTVKGRAEAISLRRP